MTIKDTEARRRYNREYAKKWYAKNREKQIKKAQFYKNKSNKRNRRYVIAHKLKHPCPCGESNTVCLSFHNIRGEKKYNVADLVSNGCSIKKLQEEIDKCVVICLNCHAIETNGNGDSKSKYKKNKKRKQVTQLIAKRK